MAALGAETLPAAGVSASLSHRRQMLPVCKRQEKLGKLPPENTKLLFRVPIVLHPIEEIFGEELRSSE